VFENERIVFEADAGTYSESVICNSSLTTDATRNITYKAAAGSEHGGVPGAGVRIQFGNLALSSVCIGVNDPFTAVEGLEFDWTDSGATGRTAETQSRTEGIVFSDCILRSAGSGVLFQSTQTSTSDSASSPVQVRNCVLDGTGNGFRLWNYGASDKGYTVTNCTITCANRAFDIYSNTDDTTFTFTNNLILAAGEDLRDQGGGGTSTVLGSNNLGPQTSATHVFPAALKGSPYPITPTTDYLAQGTDLAIYDADTGQLYDLESNAVWQAGAGTSTAGVPKLDILGVVRATGSANPGAFEAAAVIAAAVSSTFGNNVGLHANQLEVQAPWIWLYELQTNDDPPQRYRLTSFTKSVEFGLNATGQPLVYSPAPITHGAVEEGTDGSLPTISVTLGNAGPIIGAAMDAADGFVGLPVRIMLVSSLDIASGTPAVLQEGEIVSASTKTEAVVFQISAFNLYQLQFPPFIHSRRRCRWIFGSAECGYNTGIASAGFATCNKTQANCEERGDDEVAQGFARQHPARFGAFPGIPRAGQ
jgi:phage-related protein